MVELADGSTRRLTVPTGPFAWKPGPGAAPPPKRIRWVPHVVDEPIRNRYR